LSDESCAVERSVDIPDGVVLLKLDTFKPESFDGFVVDKVSSGAAINQSVLFFSASCGIEIEWHYQRVESTDVQFPQFKGPSYGS